MTALDRGSGARIAFPAPEFPANRPLKQFADGVA